MATQTIYIVHPLSFYTPATHCLSSMHSHFTPPYLRYKWPRLTCTTAHYSWYQAHQGKFSHDCRPRSTQLTPTRESWPPKPGPSSVLRSGVRVRLESLMPTLRYTISWTFSSVHSTSLTLALGFKVNKQGKKLIKLKYKNIPISCLVIVMEFYCVTFYFYVP